jgi:hypothetical protein
MAARSFSGATLPGRGRGRPSSQATDGGGSGSYARARVAAARWRSKSQAQNPEAPPPAFTRGDAGGLNQASINQARGLQRQETRFEHGDTRSFRTP